MAGATFFLAQPAISTAHGHRFRLKPLQVSSMSMPPFPSRIRKRKNHLHPKILKTLTKPLPTAPLPQLLPKEVVIPLPLENDTVLDDTVFEEADKVEDLTVTESVSTPVEYSGIVGKISAKSVLKFCGFVIGVFLIQTTVAVWVLGNDDSEDKERSFNGLNNKGKVFLSEDVKLGSELGNVVYYDEAKLEKKVSEIRAMAREARERERGEREKSSDSGIQKEIGAGLGRMGKRLNAKREKMPEKVMEYMGLFEGVEDEFSDDDDGEEDEEVHLNSQEEDRALMFKKKFRFKSPSVNQRSTPKGFSGSKDHSGSDATSESDLSLNSKQNHGAALDKERKTLREEKETGAVQGSREENSYKEVTRSQNLNGSKLQNTGGLAEENQETTKKLGGYASFGRNGSRKSERRTSINKTQPKQSEPQTEAWWMMLPYVLAILMRRGPENEAAGFYSLTSSQLDEQDSAYTVVFEDRGDANNFCYLLDSFFEELGDFRADIVPLSTEEVKSQSKKVIAVKKGQLKLYAGQPMEDVEMALRSLLEQSQKA